MLALSPCEAFLPVYLSGVSYGWRGFALLSVVLLVGCVAGMLAFTALGLLGLQRLKLEALEHHEDRIVGTLLTIVAVLASCTSVWALGETGGNFALPFDVQWNGATLP